MLGYSEHRIIKPKEASKFIEIYGELYEEVTLPTENGGRTWLGKNLIYDDGDDGVLRYNDSGYEDMFGLLYNFLAATRISNDILYNYGYRLPTKVECENLNDFRPELHSSNVYHWFNAPTYAGEDLHSFDFRGSGFASPYAGSFRFSNIGTVGYMHTSTVYDTLKAWRLSSYSGVSFSAQDKERLFPIRLIKDQ